MTLKELLKLAADPKQRPGLRVAIAKMLLDRAGRR